jgi:hypothetical protein
MCAFFNYYYEITLILVVERRLVIETCFLLAGTLLFDEKNLQSAEQADLKPSSEHNICGLSKNRSA